MCANGTMMTVPAMNGDLRKATHTLIAYCIAYIHRAWQTHTHAYACQSMCSVCHHCYCSDQCSTRFVANDYGFASMCAACVCAMFMKTKRTKSARCTAYYLLCSRVHLCMYANVLIVRHVCVCVACLSRCSALLARVVWHDSYTDFNQLARHNDVAFTADSFVSRLQTAQCSSVVLLDCSL